MGLALLLVCAFFACANPAQASTTVNFGGLEGELSKPKGKGPFPAVVLLHGCSGLRSTSGSGEPQSHIKRWLATLPKKGYVALAVDSFKPRGIERVCGRDPEETGIDETTDRVRDAYRGAKFLRKKPYVNRKRIGALGWSNGGSTVLASVGKNPPVKRPKWGGFKVAVAFYPGCGLRGNFPAYQPRVKTLVLHASEDPLLENCRERDPDAGPKFDLRIFDGAHHSFDDAEVVDDEWGAADVRARKLGDRRALKRLRRTIGRR